MCVVVYSRPLCDGRLHDHAAGLQGAAYSRRVDTESLRKRRDMQLRHSGQRNLRRTDVILAHSVYGNVIRGDAIW